VDQNALDKDAIEQDRIFNILLPHISKQLSKRGIGGGNVQDLIERVVFMNSINRYLTHFDKNEEEEEVEEEEEEEEEEESEDEDAKIQIARAKRLRLNQEMAQ
jgi:predicted aspartyl protease